jgi:hypothetical protein
MRWLPYGLRSPNCKNISIKIASQVSSYRHRGQVSEREKEIGKKAKKEEIT